MSKSGYLAIEITGSDVVDIFAAFDPTLKELDYEKDLHGNFLVCHFPESGTYAVVNSDNFAEHLDHMDPDIPNLKTLIFVKK